MMYSFVPAVGHKGYKVMNLPKGKAQTDNILN